MTEAQWAWLAGLFEGEGCITITKTQRHCRRCVREYQRDWARHARRAQPANSAKGTSNGDNHATEASAQARAEATAA